MKTTAKTDNGPGARGVELQDPRRVGARGPQESRNHAIGAPNSDSARSETAETAMRCRPGGLTGRDRKIDDRNMPMNRSSTLNHQPALNPQPSTLSLDAPRAYS